MSVMKQIVVGLLATSAVASLLYGLGAFKGAAQPLMTMGMTPIVDRQTGKPIMQPTFAFSAPVRIEALRVYKSEQYATQGELALPMWAMAGNPTSEPLRQFTYGRPIPKMKPEKPGVRADQLIRDHHYCMVMKSDHGIYEKQFVYGPQQQ